MKRLLVLVTGVVAVGLSLPAPAWAECTTPELPVVGCVVPADPTPGPSAEPAAPPTPAPVLTVAPQAVEQPAPPVEDMPVALPRVEPVLAPVPVAAPEPAVLAPVVPPPAAPAPVTVPVAAVPLAAAAPVSSLTGAVAGAFALVVFGLLALALLLGFLAGMHNPLGGTVKTARPRLWTGLGVLALAAVTGLLGWYRISDEPLLNRQIPLLASAGIVVVVLSALGGALVVAEQLRGDGKRIAELEDAVRSLTEALAPRVEEPPRRADLRSVDVLQN